MGSHNLWKEYSLNKEPAIKEKLILENISLVQKIAKKSACSLPNYINQDDLISYGIFGLLDAIDRYDPEFGIPFTGFALKRIKGSIIDGIRKEDWLPVSVRKRAKMVERAYQKVEIQYGRNATDKEVASELGISTTELLNWLKTIDYITILSLDEPLSEDQQISLKENLQNPASPNPADLTIEKETKDILAKTIEELPEKEKLIMNLYYYNELTNKEIAKVLDVTPSRVSQLHTKAILRLRGKLSHNKKL